MPPPEWCAWRASDQPKLLWRVWDDDAVVFDTRSGELHLLNPVAAEALKALEEGPTSTHGLALQLASALGIDGNEEFSRQVSGLMTLFDELGLTEPVEE